MADPSTRPIIVLAFANDLKGKHYLRNLPEEARGVRDALAPAERAGLCQVLLRQNATIPEVLDILQDRHYRNRIAVLHYGAHANSFQPMFETPGGHQRGRPSCLPRLADGAEVEAGLSQRLLNPGTGAEAARRWRLGRDCDVAGHR